jgi:hypothetical protein
VDQAQVILTKYSVEMCSSLSGLALCKVKYMWGQAQFLLTNYSIHYSLQVSFYEMLQPIFFLGRLHLSRYYYCIGVHKRLVGSPPLPHPKHFILMRPMVEANCSKFFGFIGVHSLIQWVRNFFLG